MFVFSIFISCFLTFSYSTQWHLTGSTRPPVVTHDTSGSEVPLRREAGRIPGMGLVQAEEIIMGTGRKRGGRRGGGDEDGEDDEDRVVVEKQIWELG